MTVIELPDDQAAALQAKAASRGLTLEGWFKSLTMTDAPEMASLDWSQCPAVESIPGKRSGAWVFRDSRTPVSAVFENLEAGATSVKSWTGFIYRMTKYRMAETLKAARGAPQVQVKPGPASPGTPRKA
jgi:hypothetical protein